MAGGPRGCRRDRAFSTTSARLDPLEAGMSDSPSATIPPAEKVKQFPTVPGIYLMKDAQGRVIYIGKAKNLRSRAGSYFHKTAGGDRRICDWIGEVADLEFVAADSEVDALLMEARLVKDIQPKYNRDLKDDKSFPYLQITTGEDFPQVNFTRQPRDRGVKLYGPFPRAKSLRGAIQVLQRIFKFRTCSLQIEEGDPRWKWFRPCLLASLNQCTAPCNLRIDRESYRTDIRRFNCSSMARRISCSKRWKRKCANRARRSSLRRPRGCAMRSRHSARSTCVAIWPIMLSPRCFTSIAQGFEGVEAGLEARLDSADDRWRRYCPPGRR